VVSFTPRPLYPRTLWIGGWVGSRVGLDAVAKRIHCPCRESSPGRPTHSLVAILTEVARLVVMFSGVLYGSLTLISLWFLHVYFTLLVTNIGVRIPQWNSSDGLEDRWFDSRQALVIFPFTTASRPARGPTQLPIQWILGALFLGVKQPGREADY
jgi:hypothetical protein